jgi:cell wall-associated NlpC family hydrolase
MPQYVLDIQHGDCGQVTLLYISLLRSLGIPARWESGWVFDEKGWTGYHDWGEIYFEGTGWVPTDVSAGRDTYQEPFQNFFKTSTDAYRLATNEGIGGEFSPKKKYIRRETVDFQAGEVEWQGGNLTKWKSNLIIDKITTEAEEMKALLAAIKKTYAPDSRVAIYELEAQKAGNQWIIKGKVDNAQLKANVLQELQKSDVAVVDSISVLEFTKEKPWGLVKLSIASLRTGGKHAAEMATQAIMGTPVKILEHAGDWARVQTPDQYISYVPKNSLYQITQAQLDAWRQSTRYIVNVYQTQLVDAPKKGMTVSDLVMGNILEYKGKSGKYIKLATPDGREGYVHQSEVTELTAWANQTFDAELIKKVAFRMMGSGYLWGGTSTKLTDCSGLVKVSYFANGIILQRDASQQALTGKIIKAEDWKEAQLGDLLFWGTKSGRVTHVGIYLQDGEYIHCSGQVKLNSLDPESPKWLSTPFLSISRINGMIGTKGIVMAKDHPWYF